MLNALKKYGEIQEKLSDIGSPNYIIVAITKDYALISIKNQFTNKLVNLNEIGKVISEFVMLNGLFLNCYDNGNWLKNPEIPNYSKIEKADSNDFDFDYTLLKMWYQVRAITNNYILSKKQKKAYIVAWGQDNDNYVIELENPQDLEYYLPPKEYFED